MFRTLRIPIIIVVTAVLTQAVGLAVQAAVPDTFLPSGKTRYAVAQSGTPILTWSDQWQTALSQSISIPSGQVADVMVIFCAQGWNNHSSTALQLRTLIGGVEVSPGIMNLIAEDGVIEGHCGSFIRTNVPSGQTPVRVYLRSSNGPTYSVTMNARNMIVIANLH